MNKLYCYSIYGYKIISHIKIPFLNESFENKNKKTYYLSYQNYNIYHHDNEERIEFIVQKDTVNILTKYCSFVIDFKNNKINSFSEKIEYMFSNLLNLPFSFVSLYNNELLIHASGVEDKGLINIFCGTKGSGKSTLVSFLSRKINFYNDDTINVYLKNKLIATNRGRKKIKLNQDILEKHHLTIPPDLLKTMQNKFYCDDVVLHTQNSAATDTFLDKIFFIKRHGVVKFEIVPINSNLTKKLYLLDNIIGIDFMDKTLIKKICVMPVFCYIIEKCKFFILKIPDNL